MLRDKVGELLGAGLPPGWKTAGGYALPDGTFEWELEPEEPPARVAPVVNFLVRVPPGEAFVLLLYDNCDAGVGGIHQLAPTARVLPAGLVERLPELLRHAVRFDPPNRFGLT